MLFRTGVQVLSLTRSQERTQTVLDCEWESCLRVCREGGHEINDSVIFQEMLMGRRNASTCERSESRACFEVEFRGGQIFRGTQSEQLFLLFLLKGPNGGKSLWNDYI